MRSSRAPSPCGGPAPGRPAGRTAGCTLRSLGRSGRASRHRMAACAASPRAWENRKGGVCALHGGMDRSGAFHITPSSLPLSGRQGLGAKALTPCLLYTSDAADDLLCVDLGGRRIIKKKKKKKNK